MGKQKTPQLTKKEKEQIRKSISKGAFGGAGTFQSVKNCEMVVRKQKRDGTPFVTISKRLTLAKVFNKNQNPKVAKIADSCREYAKKLYGVN